MRLDKTFTIGLLVLTAAGAACSRQSVDLSGRACDRGACLDGYTCDPGTNTCVTTGDTCSGAGQLIACDSGATSCANGCRECEDGAWAACAVPEAPPECESGLTFCSDASHLTVCSPVGYIESVKPCDYGCNATSDTPRCNECWPGKTQCRGVVFVDCSADGHIVTEQACVGESTCSGGIACNPDAGCEPQAVAPDNTPCDEGAGADGNLCNSSCVSGVCVADVGPTCDDGLACTTDSCVASSGCEHQAIAIGTVCRPAAGPCDAAEACNGTLSDCPTDAFASSGVTCRSATSVCDVTETCDGTSIDCPADQFAASGKLCRAAGDPECDLAEYCTGLSAVCPADVGVADDTACGTASCDGTRYMGHACQSHVCVASAAYDCDDGLDCNGAESCNASKAAPGCDVGINAADATPCDEGGGANGDLCDSACVGGTCVAGTAPTCHDGLGCTSDTCSPTAGCLYPPVANGTICRPSAGVCDVAETCNGTVSDCPADSFAGSTTVCRTANGVCDVAETCSGVGANCPSDAYAPVTRVCRAAQDPDCDLAEHCTGTSTSCPADTGVSNGTDCGSPYCEGTLYRGYACQNLACIASAPLQCDDGLYCDGAEACNPDPAVPCLAGTPPSCTSATCACASLACIEATDSCSTTPDYSTCTSMTLSGPSTAVAAESLVNLTLDASCGGQAANITCTAGPSARLCLYAENFTNGVGAFTGDSWDGYSSHLALATATCGSDSIALDGSVLSNNCTGKTLRFPTDRQTTATLAPATPISAAGLSDVKVHLKTGYNPDIDSGEHTTLSVRCGSASTFATLATLYNAADSPVGRNVWGELPCPSGSCSAAGYGPIGGFNGCTDIEARLVFASYSAGTQNESAQIDDFAISAVGSFNLPVTPNANGTYNVSLRPCGRNTSVSVSCTWNVPGGSPVTASTTVSVAP